MNPNVSTALLWGGFALILLGFAGCVASGGMALTGAMEPSVYPTSIRVGAVFLQMPFLVMLVGFAAVVVGAIGKAVSAFESRNNNDQSASQPPTPRSQPVARASTSKPRPMAGSLSSRGRVRYPDGVEDVTVVHNGSNVEVSWAASERATSYRVVYRTSDEASWTNAATNHVGTTYIFTEADEGATYTFAVIAMNKFGQSGWTVSVPASR